eukprot:GDKI01004940.1.p1 GENE.GDKI01004940.1~~GDKI01004940.1.p1  ORF type:complete len:142 (-),score=40.34 GDKI01004940.1:190-615(-)
MLTTTKVLDDGNQRVLHEVCDYLLRHGHTQAKGEATKQEGGGWVAVSTAISVQGVGWEYEQRTNKYKARYATALDMLKSFPDLFEVSVSNDQSMVRLKHASWERGPLWPLTASIRELIDKAVQNEQLKPIAQADPAAHTHS